MFERHESAIDRQIREATERGAFDDLPGKGKPLPQLADADDELWWVRGYLEREGISREMLLPESVQLRKELDRLPATLDALHSERAVRETVAELDARIVEYLRTPSGPRVQVGRIDTEEAVRRWRAKRPAASPAQHPADTPAPPPRPWWRRLLHR